MPDREPLTPEEKAAIDVLSGLVKTGDLYQILGVPSSCNIEQIRNAYYELSRSWHPDQFYRRDLGEYQAILDELFVGVNKAYSVLSNKNKRAIYDSERGPDTEVTSKPTVVRNTESIVTDQVDGPNYEISLDKPEKKDQKKKRRRRSVPGLDKVHDQVLMLLKKAKRHHREALAAIEAEDWVKAASEIYLASKFDPRNEEYKKIWAECDPKARLQAAKKELAIADSAMTYHNIKGATAALQKACDSDPPIGEPFFRLANLMLQQPEEYDKKEVIPLLRTAVLKNPTNVKYLLGLGEFYLSQGLKANAKREFERVLTIQPTNQEAKAGLKQSGGRR